MKSVAVVMLAVLIHFTLNCSSLNKDAKGGFGAPVVRYMNLQAVVQYCVNIDPETAVRDEAKRRLHLTIRHIEELTPGTAPHNDSLAAELEKSRKELARLAALDDAKKKEMYSGIDIAVRNVAEKNDLDFIMNIGDELVFAKKKYDITDEIISELSRLEKRTAPVSR